MLQNLVFQGNCTPASPCLSCTGDHRTGPSTPDSSHQYWTERKHPIPQHVLKLFLCRQESVGLIYHKTMVNLCHSQFFVHQGLLSIKVPFLPGEEKGVKAVICQGNMTEIFSESVFIEIFFGISYFWVVTCHIKHLITFNYTGHTDGAYSSCLILNSVLTIWKPLFNSRPLHLPLL